jgi:UDP-N-acetylglucosamine 1-carboxyvinyltransferase
MEKIIITGNGPLRGEVRVAGAKNAALPIIAASLLSAEPLHISNIPGVRDIANIRVSTDFQGQRQSQMEKVRIGMIGTGFSGDLHADALTRDLRADIVACAGTNQQRAETFAAKWKIP